MTATKTTPPPTLPADFQQLCVGLDLRIVSYLTTAIQVDTGRSLWLPRDLVGYDGLTLIVHRKADDVYNFDGWEVEHDRSFGGRYESIHAALGWVAQAKTAPPAFKNF